MSMQDQLEASSHREPLSITVPAQQKVAHTNMSSVLRLESNVIRWLKASISTQSVVKVTNLLFYA